MFYSQLILARKGPLGTLWIAAHLDRKLRKNQVIETNISMSVDSILYPEVPIALRLSGHLLLGVVRIYSRKVNYLYTDCSEALVKIKQAFSPGAVDLPPDATVAPRAAVTLPENYDLDDFDLFGVGPSQPVGPSQDPLFKDPHVSARDQITLHAASHLDIFSTQHIGEDEQFGEGAPLDFNEDLQPEIPRSHKEPIPSPSEPDMLQTPKTAADGAGDGEEDILPPMADEDLDFGPDLNAPPPPAAAAEEAPTPAPMDVDGDVASPTPLDTGVRRSVPEATEDVDMFADAGGTFADDITPDAPAPAAPEEEIAAGLEPEVPLLSPAGRAAEEARGLGATPLSGILNEDLPLPTPVLDLETPAEEAPTAQPSGKRARPKPTPKRRKLDIDAQTVMPSTLMRAALQSASDLKRQRHQAPVTEDAIRAAEWATQGATLMSQPALRDMPPALAVLYTSLLHGRLGADAAAPAEGGRKGAKKDAATTAVDQVREEQEEAAAAEDAEGYPATSPEDGAAATPAAPPLQSPYDDYGGDMGGVGGAPDEWEAGGSMLPPDRVHEEGEEGGAAAEKGAGAGMQGVEGGLVESAQNGVHHEEEEGEHVSPVGAADAGAREQQGHVSGEEDGGEGEQDTVTGLQIGELGAAIGEDEDGVEETAGTRVVGKGAAVAEEGGTSGVEGGFSVRTRSVADYMRRSFEGQRVKGQKMALSLDRMLDGKSRREAARLYFEVLVLKSRDYISVDQSKPYSDITLAPRQKLVAT